MSCPSWLWVKQNTTKEKAPSRNKKPKERLPRPQFVYACLRPSKKREIRRIAACRTQSDQPETVPNARDKVTKKGAEGGTLNLKGTTAKGSASVIK